MRGVTSASLNLESPWKSKTISWECWELQKMVNLILNSRKLPWKWLTNSLLSLWAKQVLKKCGPLNFSWMNSLSLRNSGPVKCPKNTKTPLKSCHWILPLSITVEMDSKFTHVFCKLFATVISQKNAKQISSNSSHLISSTKKSGWSN